MINDVPGLEMQVAKHAEEWEVACGFVQSNDDTRSGEFDPHFWQMSVTFVNRDALVKWMMTYGYAILQAAIDQLSEGDWTNSAGRF
jgi:hypothetical protein